MSTVKLLLKFQKLHFEMFLFLLSLFFLLSSWSWPPQLLLLNLVISEVLTVGTMKLAVLWDWTPGIMVGSYQNAWYHIPENSNIFAYCQNSIWWTKGSPSPEVKISWPLNSVQCQNAQCLQLYFHIFYMCSYYGREAQRQFYLKFMYLLLPFEQPPPGLLSGVVIWTTSGGIKVHNFVRQQCWFCWW